MFERLRRKILILNMMLISIVMMMAFTAVYVTTWQRVQSENLRKLDMQAPPTVTHTDSGNPGLDSGAEISHTVSADYLPSFSVGIDENGSILNIDSFLGLPSEIYVEAVETVLAQGKERGQINLANKDWIYKIDNPTLVQTLNGVQTVTQGGRFIMFLDVTDSRQAMMNLLLTLSVIGVFVLVAFFAISLFFSRKAVKPIAEAWEKQKQFVADASHELNTPLSIINANRDALLENRHDTIDSQIKWLDYIRVGTDRMTSLIGQLLTLAKMDGMRDEGKHETVNVSVLLLDTVRSMEAAARDKGIILSFEIEPDIILYSDGEKISTAVSILIDNAVKYCDKRIEISLKRAKRNVCLAVRNDGGGISEADLPSIFDRFYRGDKSRAGNGGYGLGLSIAKATIESLNGTINAESRPDDTVFRVMIPL